MIWGFGTAHHTLCPSERTRRSRDRRRNLARHVSGPMTLELRKKLANRRIAARGSTCEDFGGVQPGARF